jgi:hypothetical protein
LIAREKLFSDLFPSDCGRETAAPWLTFDPGVGDERRGSKFEAAAAAGNEVNAVWKSCPRTVDGDWTGCSMSSKKWSTTGGQYRCCRGKNKRKKKKSVDLVRNQR